MLQNPLVGVLPDDQADLILIMIITIPLSYLLSLIYSKYVLLTMTMALTIGFQSILFPHDRWILWIQQQIAYLLIIFSPRKYVGHIVIVQCFLALIFLHLRRLYLSYGQNLFDITGIFMMQLFNYIGLAYNYQNGAKSKDDLSQSQINRRVVQKPSYITYLGYVNFVPACLVGPVYQFVDFQNYLNRTGDYKIIPNTLNSVIKEGGVFIIALVCYGATSIFPLSRVVEPIFDAYSLPYKLLYCVLSITHIELKYVTAWSLGMMGMRASGFTYNPSKNKKNEAGEIVSYDFGRVEVNNMTKFYLEPNFKVKVDHWNISIQWALKKYIYENIYNPKKYTDEKKRRKMQANAQILTVMISALWHGLYPGYFVSFFNWALFIQIVNEFYRQKMRVGSVVHRFHERHKFVYNILENIASTFAMTFFGVAFHIMTLERVWIFVKSVHFVPFIVLYIVFILVVKMGVLGKSKKKEVKGPVPIIENPKTD